MSARKQHTQAFVVILLSAIGSQGALATSIKEFNEWSRQDQILTMTIELLASESNYSLQNNTPVLTVPTDVLAPGLDFPSTAKSPTEPKSSGLPVPPFEIMQRFIVPKLFIFVGAFLFALIVRRADIVTVLKRENQLSMKEANAVARGLRVSLVVELFIVVPSSALLMFLTAPWMLQFSMFDNVLKVNGGSEAAYTILGIASYNFPFALFKWVVTQVAVALLREHLQQERKRKHRVRTKDSE